jgi:single-stranded-DNA-specific exonuclease
MMTAPSARTPTEHRWILPSAPDEHDVAAIQSELHLPELVARLLVIRKIRRVEDARHFLRPRLSELHAPDNLLGIAAAVDRLSQAIDREEVILVHGDYDVDGICSTTLLVTVLRRLGGKAVPFVPHRLTDGYDLGAAGVKAAREHGASVVVTCDCGTSAVETVAELTALGIDVIVSDHHLPSRPVPECVAVLNPRQADCQYPDKDLCAAGVAFKLALALLARRGASENVAFRMLDLVALATIADVAPLRGENRVMVKYGLKLMRETPNVGLRALIAAAGLEGVQLTAGRIGFILAPRLNASGRVGHARMGIDLLMTDDPSEANRLARELEELNLNRQELDRATLEEARKLADLLDLDETYGLVLANEGWHPGVIGIVASRLVEELHRPVVLVAMDEGIGKGSGRSISAFDLHGGLCECRDLLLRFGGHRAAAGVTVAADRFPAFAARFNQVARERLTPSDLVPELRIDLELDVADVNDDLEKLLRYFEPFGMGNPAPTLASRGVRLVKEGRAVGKDGLKLRIATKSGELEAIGWGMADRAPLLAPDRPFDIAYRLERDWYMGEGRLVAKIVDLRC